MEYPRSRVYEFHYSISDDETEYENYKEMVNEKIFNIIQFYNKYTIFYLDFNGWINYYQIDNIRNYYLKSFEIGSFCSFFDNNERTLKHFEDKENLEEYLKIIL